MKKIGEYTARGTITEADTTVGNPQKIPLFDGRFDTGYRVIEFHIWSSSTNSGNSQDVAGKLSKNATGTTSASDFFRADDDNQIAWAGGHGDTDSVNTFFNIVDRDNLIIEDLYVYARSRDTNTVEVNYMVVMEKYEITDWQGALSMSRERAGQ